MEDRYDAVVIGAGIGGLTSAALLARNGMKVAVVEREDRVGGRALSISGEEISDRGAAWYRALLGRHYCYLAGASPPIERIVDERMLDGYTLDLGYHGVPAGGKGYLGRLADHLGFAVKVRPCDTGYYYDGEFYVERHLGDPTLDDKLYRICKEKGIHYWSFISTAFGKSEEWLDEMEKVSLWDYCEGLGLTSDPVVWNSIRCYGTLFSTINNPHEISAGEILRFANTVAMPMLAAGQEIHIGGFAEGGIISWSRAAAGALESDGGTLMLGVEATRVIADEGSVAGVEVRLPEGETARLRSARVISTVPVQETFELADAALFPADFVERSRSLYGYGSLAPYFGLSELPMPREQAERLIKTPTVVPAGDDYDYDVYMCWNVQSATDPSCSPAGRHLLTAYLPLTEEESRDRRKVMKVVEAVPEFFEGIYPGFKSCVDWALYPMCWKLEGVAKSISQAGKLKPEVRAPGVEGLYFAGDTARGFGVAMDCACSSGINCAAAILGRDLGIE